MLTTASLSAIRRPSLEIGCHDLPYSARKPGHEDDAVGEEDGFFDVVRDHECRGVGGLQDVHQELLHGPSGLCIEGSEGFVHEQYRRLVGQRPCDRDPLLHAAGKLDREGMAEAAETDQFDEVRGPLPALRLGNAIQPHAVLHVLLHRQPVERGVGLEHHAALSSGADDRLPVEHERACRGLLQSRDHAQDRRFSAARGTEQGAEVVVPNVEGDVGDCLYLLAGAEAELLREVDDRELGLLPACAHGRPIECAVLRGRIQRAGRGITRPDRRCSRRSGQK